MLHSAVESSNVRSLAWDNGTLYVEFIKTGWYCYTEVPMDKYEALIAPGVSVGKTLNAEIKPFHKFEQCTSPMITVDL
jgi:KTSC domain